MEGMAAILVSLIAATYMSAATVEGAACTAASDREPWNKPPLSMYWVTVHGGAIPSGALVGGRGSNGKPDYVCRAMYQGALVPGKTQQSVSHCDIPWGGKEHVMHKYEVLVKGLDVDIEWVDASDGAIPENAIAGGYTCTCNGHVGDLTYIGRTVGVSCPSHRSCLPSSVVFPGKMTPCSGRFYWSYGGKEYPASTYQIATWKWSDY